MPSDEKPLTRYDWGLGRGEPWDEGAYYSREDVDERDAEKDARIAELEKEAKERDDALVVALAEGLELMELKEMMKDRESDLEFEHATRVEAEAQGEQLQTRVTELEDRIDALLADADFDTTAEDYDPPVTRKELSYALWCLLGSTELDDRTLREMGNIASRLEQGEDARGKPDAQ